MVVLPSGKLTLCKLENHAFGSLLHRQINYKWTIFQSYAKLPEGMQYNYPPIYVQTNQNSNWHINAKRKTTLMVGYSTSGSPQAMFVGS